jgi:hypothetical protein
MGCLFLAWQGEMNAQQTGDFSYETNGGGITITRYWGQGSDVVIPTMLDGLPVTKITRPGFRDCATLTSVMIPDTVTVIGSGAFQWCVALRQVTIPSSVTNIANEAFDSCKSLTQLTLPDSLLSIRGAFQNCSGLTEIAIPRSLTDISAAFRNCTSLTNVVIPDSVTNLDYAFSGCGGLQNISIPDSVTSMRYSLSGCSIANVTIPSGVVDLEGTFTECTNLKRFAVPPGITNLAHSFSGCTGLADVTIPPSVNALGLSAFERCSSLTSITIPASVTNLESAVFYRCTNLNSIFFQGNAPEAHKHAFALSPATLYFLPGATGWSTNLADHPALLWNPTLQSSGTSSDGLNLTITGTTNIPILLEATTKLTSPVWVPLLTNHLSGGSLSFADAQWTNYPTRFCRVRSP